MSKARKSIIGTTKPNRKGSQISAKLVPPVKSVPAAAQPIRPAPATAVPAPTREQKPKAARQRTPRTERSNTLTFESTVERTVYSREEAASYLGTSPVTLWRVAQVGEDRDGKKLGHTRIGARVRFLREDLDRYARGEKPRPGAAIGWAKDEERAERMRQTHAARKAQG